jgi:chromosome partitioning protein
LNGAIELSGAFELNRPIRAWTGSRRLVTLCGFPLTSGRHNGHWKFQQWNVNSHVMAWLVAVANQKGGVGKTTTVHSLGYAFAELGHRVLLVDLDPQACLTFSTGIDPGTLDSSLLDVLVRRLKASDIRRQVRGVDGLSILPATMDLAAAEIHLLTRPGREYVLARALDTLSDDHDVMLIDCPPSLGVLTINALTAAEDVLIPFQCETLGHRGVGQLLEMIEDVRVFTNANIVVRGGIATMFDHHTRHSRDMLEDAKLEYGLPVLDPPVRKSIRFAEAPRQSRCILQHASDSPGAAAYRTLARQLDAVLTSKLCPGSSEVQSRQSPVGVSEREDGVLFTAIG